MPRTSRVFMVGAIAICGLPPLNGFVERVPDLHGPLPHCRGRSEWNLGLGAHWPPGAGDDRRCLRLARFVKLLGVVFAGVPRTRRAEHAHDPGALMHAADGVPCSLLRRHRVGTDGGDRSRGSCCCGLGPNGTSLSSLHPDTHSAALDLGDRSVRDSRVAGRRSSRPWLASPPALRCSRDMGLWLRPADGKDAIHRVLLRANADGLCSAGRFAPKTHRCAMGGLFPSAPVQQRCPRHRT